MTDWTSQGQIRAIVSDNAATLGDLTFTAGVVIVAARFELVDLLL